MKQLISTLFLSFWLTGLVGAENYPAAYFQPKIIYSAQQNDSANPVQTPKKPDEADEYDPQYPAASFHPKVIFTDSEQNTHQR